MLQTPVPRRAALPPPDTTRRPLGSARPARPRTLPGCGNPQVRVQNDVETVRIPLDNHIQLSRHVPILPSSSESGGILSAEAVPAEHESLTAGRAPASSPWRLDQSSRLVLHGYANSPRSFGGTPPGHFARSGADLAGSRPPLVLRLRGDVPTTCLFQRQLGLFFRPSPKVRDELVARPRVATWRSYARSMLVIAPSSLCSLLPTVSARTTEFPPIS